MSTYWNDRQQASLRKITNKSQKEIDKKLKSYYRQLSRQIIGEYENLYNELLVKQANGEEISPATLYNMEKYYSMNAQIRKSLTRRGNHMIAMMSKIFEIVYKDSYNAINIKGLKAFSTMDEAAIQQVLNSIWCSDGLSWSKRIWNNMALLQQTLEEGLVESIVTGKKPTQLKQILQERFNVSYSRANTLVRTETAWIQNQACIARYKDYGVSQVQWWTDPDERTCKVCGKLHKNIYPIGANIPCPAHPRCRCTIIPVVDTELLEDT